MQSNDNSTFFVTEDWIILKTVDSTNSYAKLLLSKSKPVNCPTVILAENQTAGRGRNNHNWLSEPGKNLTVSLILDTAFLPLTDQFILNQTICLGILDFLRTHISSRVLIKWPNDLYVDVKKIGGVLIENIISGGYHKQSIIGIGLNINQKIFPDKLSEATSLTLETSLEYDLISTLERLLTKIASRLSLLRRPEAFLIQEDFQQNLLGLGQLRYYRDQEDIFQGIMTGVNPAGKLKIRCDGTEKSYGMGDLTFIL